MRKRLHRLLTFLAIVSLVCVMVPLGNGMPVSAEENLFFDGMTNHFSTDDDATMAISFRFSIAAKGVAVNRRSIVNLDRAVVEPFGDGVEYTLTSMGVLMANDPDYGTAEMLVKEQVSTRKVTDVTGEFAVKVGRDYVAYAARLKNIPVGDKPHLLDTIVYARPYYVYKSGKKDCVVYGDILTDTVCGKQREYNRQIAQPMWEMGGLDAAGAEVDSTSAMRTTFINDTDVMLPLLPENTGLTAYFYGREGYLSNAPVADNWTSLKELDVPESATCLRLVAYDTNGAAIQDALAYAANLNLYTSRDNEQIPLTYESGSLSPITGALLEDDTRVRTGYLPVEDMLINPLGDTAFSVYFYDADGTFISARQVFTDTSKHLLEFAPDNAAYVRLVVRGKEELPLEGNVPLLASDVKAYLPGSAEYSDPSEDVAPETCEHTYDNACDVDCNVCGEVRIVADHVYDDKYDGDCNACGVTRDVPTRPVSCQHVYSNACDEICNRCDEVRVSASHVYDTACDAICNVCGISRIPADHVYTDKYDCECNVCGHIRDVEIDPSMLVADVPENQGVANALLNMAQLVKLKYTAKATIPQALGDIPAGANKTGLPYSSTRIEQLYVGSNVSFHTFMTAVQNPNSYLYTVDLGEDYGNVNGDTYYGVVCSTAVGYALGLVPNYTTYQWLQIPGMELISEQGVQGLKLGDSIVNDTDREGHVVMVTGIERDSNGKIYYVTISQAAGAGTSSKRYSAAEIDERYPADKWYYCRYAYIDQVQHTPSEYVAVGGQTAQAVTYNTTLIPRKGDKANWLTSQTVEIDVLRKGSYTKVEIYKDGAFFSEMDVPANNLISLSGLAAGSYQARLKNDSSTSDWCYWIVVETNVQVSLYENNRRVRLDFTYSDNATPLYVQWMNGNTNATIRITNLTDAQISAGSASFKPEARKLKVRIAFQTEYGIVYSELPEAFDIVE